MSTVKIKDDYGWQSVASIKESDTVLPKDVNFYDYDGSLVYSYTASEFLIHNMMPVLPEHKGLKGQEWNWSIEKAKAYVLKYSKLDIGATYITDDGKTRVYIFIDDPVLLTMRMAFTCNGSITVDWGDGSSTETVNGTSVTTTVYTNNHTFPSIGRYILSLAPADNSVLAFYHGANNDDIGIIMPPNSYSGVIRRRYYGLVEKIEFGKKIYCFSGVTSNADGAFRGLYNLKYATIPKNILEGYGRCFYECVNLRCIIFPRGRNDNIAYQMFHKNYSLSRIVMAESMTGVNNAFESCTSLKNVCFPDEVTEIGSASFKNCGNMTSVIIPSSVTSIKANAFNACDGLHEVHFTSSTPPTLESSNAFSSISEHCKFYVPTGSLSAYTSATNYPSSSTYTYIEE